MKMYRRNMLGRERERGGGEREREREREAWREREACWRKHYPSLGIK
jgi:hypothetical protein